MGFRFHRSFQILPGVRINVSKGGFSLSLGEAPVTFNFGRRGGRVTTSLPGTGMSYTKTTTDAARSGGGWFKAWLSRLLS